MRWLLYGDLGERHVVGSLADALGRSGHDVARLPSLVAATGALDHDLDRERERARLIDEALPADVMFVFRVDEVTPRLLSRARDRGVTTIGWLCDDPLYYDVTYRHVVGSYDLTLHTARADLLAYYEDRHDVRGYAFPYWTDDAHYPYVFDPDAADIDVGFVGSFGGHARRIWRYDLLASLPFDVRFYGPVTRGLEDYAAMGLGVLEQEAIPRALRRFRVAVNMAQTFDEGAVDRWTFPELARFREYFFPSRLVAYAAAGVPTVSLQRPGLPAPLSSIRSVSSRAGMVEAIEELLSDRARLVAASRGASDEFEACLTARSRIAMLEALLGGERAHPLRERAELWRTFGTKRVPLPGVVPSAEPGPTLDELERAIPVVPPADRASSLSIAMVGRGGRVEGGFARGARHLGHDVTFAELSAAGEVPRGFGPVDVPFLDRLVERTRPDVAVFVDGAAPSDASAAALRREGVTSVAVRLADPAYLPDTTSYLDRFDLIVTTSEEAAAAYRAKGSARVEVITPGAEPSAPPRGAVSSVALVGGETAEGMAAASRVARAVETRDDAPVAAILPDAADAETPAAAAAGVVAIAPAGRTSGLSAEREVLAYRDVAQLVGIAAYYARRPDETEPIRRAAFARVVTEHRWTERWPSILAGVSAPRAQEPRVILLGYYGMDNLGDELLLDVVSARLGNARAQAIGYGPGAVAAGHGLGGAHVLDADATEDLVRDADLLVVGGGGVLHDRELAAGATLDAVFDDPGAAGIIGVIARHAALAAAHATPVALLAIGAGPIDTAAGRSAARFLVDRAVTASVRDRASLDALRPAAPTRDVLLAADPTLLVPPPDRNPALVWLGARGVEPDRYLTVAMRRWAGAPADLASRVAAVLDQVVERTGFRVVFLPFQRDARGRRDEGANRAVAAAMRRNEAAVELDEPGRELALGVLAGARIGIGMRLHASILGNAFGVPTLGFAYDPKVAAHYAETGVPDRALPLDVAPQRAVELASDLIARRDEHSAALAGPVAALRDRAEMAFAPLMPLVAIKEGRARRTRAERDASLEELRRELRGG